MNQFAKSALTAACIALCALLCAPRAALCEVDIELWTTEEEPDRQAVIRYLIDAFMALHDDVRVRVIAFDENELPHAMATAARTGTLPALVDAGSELLVSFAEAGWLDSRAANSAANVIGRDRFFEGALRSLSNPDSGDLYALPFHGWVQGIWYRADWFAEAGLKPPDSLPNILAAAERLNDPKAGRYGILIGTTRDSYAEQVFTHLALAQGIREFDKAGRLVFNTPRTVQLLENYRHLASFSPPGPQSWRARDYFLQGRLAMMFYSSFIMDDLALSGVAADSLTGDNFENLDGAVFDPNLLIKTGMVSVIDGPTPSSYGVMSGIGFGRDSSRAQRGAAMSLARFLYRDDVYVTWLHMAPGGMLPVLRDMADKDLFYRDLQGVFRRFGRVRVNAVVRGLEQIRSFSLDDGRLNPAAARIMARGIIPQMIHKALFQGLPSTEAVAWAETQMRSVLEEQ